MKLPSGLDYQLHTLAGEAGLMIGDRYAPAVDVDAFGHQDWPRARLAQVLGVTGRWHAGGDAGHLAGVVVDAETLQRLGHRPFGLVDRGEAGGTLGRKVG